MPPLLDVQKLVVEYSTLRGRVRAVSGVSFSLERGSTLGLVGESACGKSTLGFSILRLVPPPGRIVAGKIDLEGVDLADMPLESIRSIRGSQVSMIFQDPMTSLNPLMKIRDHFTELFQTHQPSMKKEESVAKTTKLLDSLGIGADRIDDYPHQFSGGMRQRVMIGLALALEPKLVIADEPTTSLDVIVEAQVLELLKRLKEEHRLTLILITHNIGIVAEMAETIAVMYAGQIVETGPTGDMFEKPLHPYTKGLLESAPNVLHPEQSMRPIPGTPPDLLSPPSGCKFHPRCPKAFDICPLHEPRPKRQGSRLVACHLYSQVGS
jgi:peptide/nickel transport system ATP-binding protein